MKKRKIFTTLALLAIVALGLFVSCSGNIMDDVSDTLVYATFDKNSRATSATSSYTQTVTLKEINEVYWTYTATKAEGDNAGETGQTTTQTAVKSDFGKGLDDKIGPFSQGLWDFEIYGYTGTPADTAPSGTEGTDYFTVVQTDDDGKKSTKYYTEKVYYGKTKSSVELKDGTESNPDPINVIINLLTEGTGTFAISNTSDFSWQEDSGSAYSGLYLTMLATSGSTTKSETFGLEYDAEKDKYFFKKTSDKWPTLSWDFSSGSWTMKFAVVKASADNTRPTYDTTGSSWSGVKYTFTTSPELLVKIYAGQTTTLEANIIESNLAWGKINGSVASIKASTVTETVEENKETKIESNITPQTASSDTVDNTKKTTVTIPSGTNEFTEGSEAAITITATPIVTANSLFKISASTGAVGAIDLKATVTRTGGGGTSTTEEVTSFTKTENGESKAVEVTIDTYIAVGMTNVKLSYTDGNGKTETWNATASKADNSEIKAPSGDADGVCFYDGGTGKLVYKTTHFSTFLVGADQNVYDADSGVAYKLSTKDSGKTYHIYDRNEKIIKESASDSGGTYSSATLGKDLVLLDCALSNNVPDAFVTDCTTEAEDKKTWSVIHHNCAGQKGYFWHKEYPSYFPSGYGTKLEPYIIEGTKELENTYYFENAYAYYKVGDEISVIDCSGLRPYYVRLSGSLDGNGVKFENNTGNMFYSVYSLYSLNTPVVLKNFEANFNLEGSLDIASGMIYVLGGNETTFRNVKVTGKMEGGSNSGVFYTYPLTMWYSMSDGYTQKVNLEKCTVTAELYAPNGTFGIIAGHPTYYMDFYKSSNGKTYSPNAKLVVKCDKTLEKLFEGTAYTKKETDGKSYVTFFNLNNDKISFSDDSEAGIKTNNKKECNSFYTYNITYDQENGYSVTWVDGAKRMKVYIAAQFTEADSSGTDTANVGITLGLADWKTINKTDDDNSSSGQNVLGVVDSVDVKMNSNYNADYDSENKKLTAYVPWSGSYVYGTIKLQVAQYNENDKMIGYGTKVIASKSTYNGNWSPNP